MIFSFFDTGVNSSLSAAEGMSAPHLVWSTPGGAIKQRSRPQLFPRRPESAVVGLRHRRQTSGALVPHLISGPDGASRSPGPRGTYIRDVKWVKGFTVINMPRAKSKLIDQQPIARTPMQKPPLDPDVADTAPSDPVLTVYDEEHIITYLRLLDADAVGADWREVARVVLHLDPEHESDRARRAFESHLSRAKWMTEHGYRLLLRGGASA
jgi:type VI secretion system activator RovC-like protein